MIRPLLLLACALAGAALGYRRDLREAQAALAYTLTTAQALREDLQRAQQSELLYRVELERARTPLAGAGERGGFRTWDELRADRGQA